jgi:glycosyltransferase involved in cell wall biosynthesis
MNIQILTGLGAVSFKEVSRVVKRCMDEYGYNCHISDIYTLWMPNIPLSPSKKATWDLMITIHTLQDNVIQRFKIFGNKLYSEKSWLYGVVEGKPKISYRDGIDNKIIVPSNFCKDMIESVGIKVRAVIPHGIIHNEFVKTHETEKEINRIKDIFGDRKILLYIGNGDPRKAIPRLIDALGILKNKRRDWVCIMVTDERIRKEGIGIRNKESPPIDKIVHDKNLQHHIIWGSTLYNAGFGNLTRTTIASIYHSCDLHLLPSYCEGFGIPLIEAGACYKTTVYIDAPPMNEILNKDCGYPVPYTHIKWTQDYQIMDYKRHVWEPEEYAETIDYALSDKDREEKEQKNHENSLKYDYKKTYRGLLELE